jgi:hypothetical protein
MTGMENLQVAGQDKFESGNRLSLFEPSEYELFIYYDARRYSFDGGQDSGHPLISQTEGA